MGHVLVRASYIRWRLHSGGGCTATSRFSTIFLFLFLFFLFFLPWLIDKRLPCKFSLADENYQDLDSGSERVLEGVTR